MNDFAVWLDNLLGRLVLRIQAWYDKIEEEVTPVSDFESLYKKNTLLHDGTLQVWTYKRMVYVKQDAFVASTEGHLVVSPLGEWVVLPKHAFFNLTPVDHLLT